MYSAKRTEGEFIMADTNKKLVDLSLLTYYDGKVSGREDTKDTTVLNINIRHDYQQQRRALGCHRRQ